MKDPLPSSIDPSAKTGLFQQEGKPDANVAQGLNNYLETKNVGAAIFRRSRIPLMRSTYPEAGSPSIAPSLTWDHTAVASFSASCTWLRKRSGSQSLSRAVPWPYCNYSFPTPSGHDFDKLGVDSDGVYFGFNVLAPGSNNVVSNELFYPSAIMTPNGHMLFVYNASGSSIYPIVWYVQLDHDRHHGSGQWDGVLW